VNPAALVGAFWEDLYRRDWDAVAGYFGDDSEYTDVPTPPEDVARGARRIVDRLRVGLGPLASIGHDVLTVVADGEHVVTEHTEHWEWPTGERAALPFVSVMRVAGGRIARWWDYWDLATLMGAAPQWWVEHIMTESARVGLRTEDRVAHDRPGPAPA
jgi:limonene-1,2-epoxide hydrolase